MGLVSEGFNCLVEIEDISKKQGKEINMTRLCGSVELINKATLYMGLDGSGW